MMSNRDELFYLSPVFDGLYHGPIMPMVFELMSQVIIASIRSYSANRSIVTNRCNYGIVVFSLND